MYVGSVLAQPPTTKTIIGGIYFVHFYNWLQNLFPANNSSYAVYLCQTELVLIAVQAS